MIERPEMLCYCIRDHNKLLIRLKLKILLIALSDSIKTLFSWFLFVAIVVSFGLKTF